MKRFWTTAEAVSDEAGWTVALDGKPLRTPARARLLVPTESLAGAIAEEWNAVEGQVEPGALALSGLANAAIDRIAPDPQGFAAGLARFGEGELACYRAQGPAPLVERQSAEWDRLLGWARRRFDVDFCVTDGIMHVDQPPATVARLAHAVAILDPFRLAGLSPLVTIGGSLVAALGVLEQAFTPEDAWAAVTVDDVWQREQWGADAEADAALAGRHRDFMAAARFLELL